MVNDNRRAEQEGGRRAEGVEGLEGGCVCLCVCVGGAPRGESMENSTQAVFVGCNQPA